MGYNISVKEGDLLQEESADFIVNASNTRLILGSGVSLAFKRHCGIELQKEMDQALSECGGNLQPGDVVVTSSCKATNFTYVLHVAVMNYNRGVKNKNPTLDTIKIALENIERYVSFFYKKTNKSATLVLPLMGCGVGGLDKRKVINIYQKFFQQEVAFTCNVVIYGYTAEDYKLIRIYFLRVFG